MKHNNYIAIEGPDGSGKTTVVGLLREEMIRNKYDIYKAICQPSKNTPLGKLIREEYLSGCKKHNSILLQRLINLDRFEQHQHIIDDGHLTNGGTVLVDRSFMSGLVYMMIDNIELNTAWDIINDSMDISPGIIFVLTAGYEELARRIHVRNVETSIYETEDSIRLACEYYNKVSDFLKTKGYIINIIDTSIKTPVDVMEDIMEILDTIDYDNIETVNSTPVRMLLNPDPNRTEKIIKAVYRNDGNCPCRAVKEGVDSRCPCPPFLDDGYCCCNLFVKEEGSVNNGD